MDESTAARLTNGIDLEGQIKAEFVKAASLRELRPANSAALTARVPSVPMPEAAVWRVTEGQRKSLICGISAYHQVVHNPRRNRCLPTRFLG